MGQAHGSTELLRATKHSPYTADSAATYISHHVNAKQLWDVQMEAKRRLLSHELRTLLEEGTQPSLLPLFDRLLVSMYIR